MKKFLTMVLAGTLALTLLVGCGAKTSQKGASSENASAGKDLPVLRVAMMPYATSLPAQYIKKNGLDIKAGFRMETTMFASGAPMNEALAADLWDVGAMGAAAVTGVANYDMMIIGEILESQDGLAVFAKPNSKITKVKGFNPSLPDTYGDPESVKGSTILLPIGTAQHFTVLKWLEKIGVKPNEVKIVNMETAQAYQALKAGQCDAVALNVPTFFDAANDNMVQVANLAKLGTKYVDMVTANRKSLKTKNDIIEKYMALTLQACDELNKDNDMTVKLMLDFAQEAGAKTTEAGVRSDLKRLKFLGKSDWNGRKMGTFARELGEFYIGNGQLEPSVMKKFDTNIVDTYINKAIAK